MNNDSLCWLHLSDLHLCKPKTGWEANSVIKALTRDFIELQKYGLYPDFIFFTGDAAYGNLGREAGLSIAEQFQEALRFFEDISTAFSPAVPKENMFIVPGNHDVNRAEIPNSITLWLSELARNQSGSKTIEDMIRTCNKDWRICMDRLADYAAFLSLGEYNHLIVDQDRLIYSTLREIHGIKVGIVGLNSAWSCSGDGEKGKLWLGGHWQLQTLLHDVDQADIKISLMHHPPNWLVEAEDPSVGREIEMKINFFLHGHEHQNWVHQTNNQHHVRIAAGACYGSTDQESGYNFVRLNLSEGTAEVWLRSYDRVGGGWIPRVIHGRTDDRGVFTLNNLPLNSNKNSAKKENSVNKNKDEMHESSESRGVFGRQSDIKKIIQRLSQYSILTIFGLSGIGKSKLLQEVFLTNNYRSYGYLRFTAYPHLDLNSIYNQVTPALGNREEYPASPIRLFHNLDFSNLSRYAKDAPPTIIHIDRAHHLFGDNGFYNPDVRDFLLAIAKFFPKNRIILESREIPPLDILPREIHSPYKVTGLGLEGVRTFFCHPFVYEESKGWNLSNEEANIILQRFGDETRQGGAHPLGMFLLAQVADGMNETPLQVLKRHEHILLNQLEQGLFIDLFENVLSEPEQRLLRVCGLYRDYIPDLHVGKLNHLVGDTAAFDHLAKRCILNSDKIQEKYYLHPIITDLTKRKIDHESDEFYTNHEYLADTWLSQYKISQHISLANIYAITEAAYHLTEACRFDLLDDLPTHLLKDGDFSLYIFNIAHDLFRKGNLNDSKRIFELLVAINSKNHIAHRYLGKVIEKIYKVGDERALGHYRIAYELQPVYPPYLGDLGQCLFACKKAEEYLQIVDSLPSIYKDKVMNDRNLCIKARCLEQVNRGKEASQLRMSKIDVSSSYALFYIDEAKYLVKHNAHESALRLLVQAEKVIVHNEIIILLHTTILDDVGRNEEASNIRMAKIEAHSRFALFYNNEALSLQKAGKTDEALSILELAIKSHVVDDIIWITWTNILTESGNIEAASLMRIELIMSNTRTSKFYIDEADHQYKIGNIDTALRFLGQGISISNNKEAVIYKKTEILDQQHFLQEASSLRIKQILKGTRNGGFFIAEAQYLSREGKNVEALDLLAKAVQRDATRLKTIKSLIKTIEKRNSLDLKTDHFPPE